MVWRYKFLQMQPCSSLFIVSLPHSTGEAWTPGEFCLLVFAVIMKGQWVGTSQAPLKGEELG